MIPKTTTRAVVSSAITVELSAYFQKFGLVSTPV